MPHDPARLRRGGLKKVDAEDSPTTTCLGREHNPPSHIVLANGTYEWTCPNCGHVTRFVVNRPVH